MVRRTLLLVALVPALLAVCSAQAPEATWRFAVSGDSRNCGDVVMPAIAKSVLAHDVRFYWHLGDFRLGSDVDEDIQQPKLTIKEYQKLAWDDFREHQIAPFGSLTVHLGIGNHELYLHGSTAEDERQSHKDFIHYFSQWLGGSNKAYYGWSFQGVDFINLDNSMPYGFDEDQLLWLKTRLEDDQKSKDAKDPEYIHSVAVGMHRALPNSLACGHSMNGDPEYSAEDNRRSLESGRRVYEYLWEFKNRTGKNVYVLASHSHFYMEDVFNTDYWNNKNEKDQTILDSKKEKEEKTLKGWIIGTAGAKRYRLPDNLPPGTLVTSYVYGYLLATVQPDHSILFEFQKIIKDDVPAEVTHGFSRGLVDSCFLSNRDDSVHSPEASCSERYSRRSNP